jgi:hypothetical protein
LAAAAIASAAIGREAYSAVTQARPRVQPERRLGDQAERALRPREQLAQVVAGHVLDHLAAGLGHDAVGPHHGDPDEQVTRRPVAQPPRAGQPGRDHAADRGLARHVQRDLLPGLGQHRRYLGHPGARPDPGHQVPGRVLDHAGQPGGVDDQVAAGRWRAPGQP